MRDSAARCHPAYGEHLFGYSFTLSADNWGIARDHVDHLRTRRLVSRRGGPGMTGVAPTNDYSATYVASVANRALETWGATVTAAFAIRFPLGSLIPGTEYRVGRRDDVGHFAPISRTEAQLLLDGALDGLTTLCRIKFTFGTAIHIPGADLFRTVACDRCLITARTLPELLLL